jgi:hypothetical protein
LKNKIKLIKNIRSNKIKLIKNIRSYQTLHYNKPRTVYYQDYSGSIINGFIVNKLIKTTKNKYNKTKFVYECICSCGKTFEVPKYSIVTECRKDCGCTRTQYNKLSFGEACFNEIFYNYKRRASKKYLEFKLTKSQFFKLTQLPCYYCKFPPFSIQKGGKQKFGSFKYNGLDRINNKIGYTIDNVVTCCEFCNRAKYTHKKEEFERWLKHVQQKSQIN